MAHILYFGDSSASSTSAHRARALERVGHVVVIKDPFKVFSKQIDSTFLGALHFRTGYTLLQSRILNWVSNSVRTIEKVELIWIDSGELFGAECLICLKRLSCPIILYNIDDPTGERDGQRFLSLLKALPLYDLVVVVRKESEHECLLRGAKSVIRVYRSYDEVAHRPFDDINDIPEFYKSEVAFIGTWMRHEKRDEFLVKLLDKGVALSIWGDRWMKSKYWKSLQHYYKGGALAGRDYVAAIQGAKVCLGFLSKGNRDLHTTRSLEIPFAGGLLCAERTIEHEEMYHDKKEAVFWSDAEECAQVCSMLLQNDLWREEIRLGGTKRVRTLKVGNEDICERIVSAVLNA